MLPGSGFEDAGILSISSEQPSLGDARKQQDPTRRGCPVSTISLKYEAARALPRRTPGRPRDGPKADVGGVGGRPSPRSLTRGFRSLFNFPFAYPPGGPLHSSRLLAFTICPLGARSYCPCRWKRKRRYSLSPLCSGRFRALMDGLRRRQTPGRRRHSARSSAPPASLPSGGWGDTEPLPSPPQNSRGDSDTASRWPWWDDQDERPAHRTVSSAP